MNICLCFSKNWSHYVAVEVYALFKNNIKNAPIKVYLMSEELTRNDLIEFDNVCNYFGSEFTYQYIEMKDFYNKHMENTVNTDSRFTKYTNFRLAIPYLIPDDRLLYIDTDALVCNDLSELYNMDLEGNWIAGVEDLFLQQGHKTSLGFSEDSLYFNAGVLLLDLYKIRESLIADKWLYLLRNKHFPAHDQDIVFSTIYPRFKKVDVKYNISLSTCIDLEKVKDISICHFAGATKPWNDKTVPFFDIWEKYEKEYTKVFESYKSKQLIPKILHGCWFGKNKMPQIMQDYLDTWKEKCPDYEIKIWDETNFDVNKYRYTKEAYAQKKYAFVADVCKLESLIQYGGIALDLDVEVLKSFDDFLYHRCFTGYQENFMITAVLGSEKNHPYIKYLLSYYNDAKFDMKPNTYIIDDMAKSWVKKKEKNITWLKEEVAIYSEEVFCPYSHKEMKVKPTEKSYAIHHFTNTWGGKTKVMSNKFKIDLQDIFDESIYWQMNISEKSSILYLLEKMKNKNTAIEIGSYRGGFLRILDKYFKKVYSCDIDHSLLTNKNIYKKVDFVDGDSKATLPILIDKINNSDEIVNFVLIDADHEYDGVKKDIKNILKIKPKDDLIILIHDSWYDPSRAAIIDSDWNSNPYVHYIDTDFVAGDICYSGMYGKDILISGLALIIMSPEKRDEKLNINQSQDKLYCTISK